MCPNIGDGEMIVGTVATVASSLAGKEIIAQLSLNLHPKVLKGPTSVRSSLLDITRQTLDSPFQTRACPKTVPSTYPKYDTIIVRIVE